MGDEHVDRATTGIGFAFLITLIISTFARARGSPDFFKVLMSRLSLLFGVVAFALAAFSDGLSNELVFTKHWFGVHWGGSLLLMLFSLISALAGHIIVWSNQRKIAENIDQRRTRMNLLESYESSANDPDNAGSPINYKDSNGIEGFRAWLPHCTCCVTMCGALAAAVTALLLVISIDFYSSEPATSCFAQLPMDLTDLTTSFPAKSYLVGEFTVTQNADGSLWAALTASPSRVVWATLPREGFLRVGVGNLEMNNDKEMGSFKIVDENLYISYSSFIDSIEEMRMDNTSFLSALIFRGHVQMPVQNVAFNLTFSNPQTNHLAFAISVDREAALNNLRADAADPKSSRPSRGEDAVRVYLVYESRSSQRFFGFGEQFSYFDLKGSCVPSWTREQGIARGLQPLSYSTNRFSDGAGGSSQTTYTAVPHYITSDSRSLFLEDTSFSVFDLTDPSRVSLEVVTTSGTVRGRILAGETPLDLIESYTLFAGRPRPLPAWVSSGAVAGLQGGTQVVQAAVDKMLNARVPLAAVWLQDWTGKRGTSFGDRLLWNWQVNLEHYPGWWDFVSELAANPSNPIRVLTYINPYLADFAPDASGTRVAQPMFQEALKRGCLIRNQHGETLIQAATTHPTRLVVVNIVVIVFATVIVIVMIILIDFFFL